MFVCRKLGSNKKKRKNQTKRAKKNTGNYRPGVRGQTTRKSADKKLKYRQSN